MTILLIIILIILIIRIQDLKKDNEVLMNQLTKIPNFCSKCGQRIKGFVQPINNIVPQPVQQPVINQQPFINQQPLITIAPPEPQPPKYTDTEIKNSLILIVGSCLLIIAAILFLTTTWTTTSDYLKTFILIMMLVIFGGASYLADKVLNIKQTAKAFYYLALAYLPIVFISIYLFELLGEFFSSSGAGKNIYLAISFLIVTIVYYISSKKRDESITGVFSIIFSLLTLFFIINQFTTEYLYYITIYTIYTFILNILYSKNIYYSKSNIHLAFICILTILLVIPNLIPTTEIIHYINLLLLFINIYYLLNKTKQLKNIYEIVYPIYMIYTFMNISFYLGNEFYYTQIFIFISYILIYLYDYINNKKLLQSSNIIINISLVILIQQTVIATRNYLPLYIVIFVASLINYIYYIINEEKLTSYFGSILLLIGMELLFNDINIPIVYLQIVLLSIYLVFKYLIKDLDIKKTYTIPTTILFIFNTLLLFTEENHLLIPIILLIFTIIKLIEYLINNKEYNKVLSYIYSNIFIFSILNNMEILTICNIAITISIINIFIILIENTIPRLKTKNSFIYILINTIISYLLLNIQENIDIYLLSILLVLDLIFIVHIFVNEKDKELTIISFLATIPYLYLRGLEYSMYLSILFIIFFDYLIYKKKENIYIVYFFIYTILHMFSHDQSEYVYLALLSSGTFLSYIVKENKPKEVFKVLLSIEILYFVKLVIHDLELPEITVFNMGPFYIWYAFITRNILKKHIPDYKVLEYLGFIFLNILTIRNYTSDQDGTIFVIFLILLVIGSYTLKYGPIFLVSLFAIIVNIVLLTRDFWLNLPWWLYVLITGLILIGFAIYNEIREKKPVIKDIKDKLDL